MKRLIKSRVTWITFLVTILLTLGALYRFEEHESRRIRKNRDPEPVGITIDYVKRGKIAQWIVGEGTVKIVKKQYLQFQNPGKIVFIGKAGDGKPLYEGARVFGPQEEGLEGQLLAELENEDYTDAIQQTEIELVAARLQVDEISIQIEQAVRDEELMRRNFNRAKTIFEKGISSISEFETQNNQYRRTIAQLKSLNLQLKIARNQVKRYETLLHQNRKKLKRMRIRAPFDGVIGRLNIKTGEQFFTEAINYSNDATLQATIPVIIIDPALLEVTLNLPVYDGVLVNPGAQVRFRAGGLEELQSGNEFSEQDFKAYVYSVSPILTAHGRTVRIKVRIHQKEPSIPEGLLITCWIRVKQKSEVDLVPNRALLFEENSPFVFLVKNGHVSKTFIKTGLEEEDYVEVRQGLKIGDPIVVGGKYRLYDRALVETLNTGIEK